MSDLESAAFSRTANAIHIVCSVHNGELYLREFITSLQAQTVKNWLCWVRDDGSRDGSVTLLNELAATDERLRLLQVTGEQIGVVRSFNEGLQQVPSDARYIMFADQDDVWLPNKIEYTLSAMMLGEEHSSSPLLVHTDMIVVDETLNEIDDSFWHFARINPEATSLQRLLARNIATGATMMMNRALREKVGQIPAEAAVHDWWVAIVASAFGNIIAVSTPTMLYRQHGRNAIGARKAGSTAALLDLPAESVRAFGKVSRVRSDIRKAAVQARAFLARFGGLLNDSDSAFLSAYAQIPDRPFLKRKLDIARLHLQREDGLLKNAGLLLRA